MAWSDQTLTSDGVPLWFQIAALLRDAISAGEFQPGTVLPSEADLFRVFGVSRTTARSSLDKLEQEGLIVRRSGRGSIVLEPRVEQPLNLLGGFSEDMRRRGLSPSHQTLSAAFAHPPTEVHEALEIGSRRKAYRIHRLLKANNSLIASSTSWLSPTILKSREPPGIAELDGGSLYVWLEAECGVRLCGGQEIIEAQGAGQDIAALLEVEVGTPVLVATRTSRDETGRPVEQATITYRADRYRFRLDLSAP
ncbi:GntR family transcriptional regulator [Aureimonas sp. ME7]|uniref:GntR family transcriptional regulator n=1 Tax=Aureimonas sp. ME7 TaxID=2744252 RepID=UPI0015F8652E|nr:GntR family transcriptional regulator [Aureimonas sp. ME7]